MHVIFEPLDFVDRLPTLVRKTREIMTWFHCDFAPGRT